MQIVERRMRRKGHRRRKSFSCPGWTTSVVGRRRKGIVTHGGYAKIDTFTKVSGYISRGHYPRKFLCLVDLIIYSPGIRSSSDNLWMKSLVYL